MPVLYRSTLALALAALALTACGDDGATSPAQLAPRGIAVLDGFIQPGLTLVADTGTSTQRLAFGAPNEFDAGSFELRSDTAVAATSRGAGDLLYIADLRTASVRRVQMPARSNPARARLLRGSNGRALIGVPLRDSASVILASVAPGGQTTLERIGGLGTCPVDVFQRGTDTWVVDANATCATNYTPIGPMRLIRVPAGSGARQVIVLPELRGSGASVIVVGEVAYITAGGDADFSTFPFTLRASGAVTRVDLRTGTVLGTRTLPAGTFGGNAKLGLDGQLQVTLFEDLANFRSRTISYRLPELTPVGDRVAGADWLALRNAAGEQVSCSGGRMDGLGRLHCLQNRTGSATFLLVFAPGGGLVREVAAGQGGVDLQFR